MNLLRGLRVNCFLAALIPCLLACLGLAYQSMRNQQHMQLAYANEASHSLNSYADLLKDQGRRHIYLNAIKAGDTRWHHMSIVNVTKVNDDFKLNIDTLIGDDAQLERDNPHPDLIKSQLEPQHWALSSNHIGVACPLRLDHQDLGVLYGELRIPSQESNTTMILIISACLFSGILIALYLSRRIYKPIESLCDEAEAAIQGHATTAALHQSTETAHVASSINDLLKQFQAQNASMSSLDSESTEIQQHE